MEDLDDIVDNAIEGEFNLLNSLGGYDQTKLEPEVEAKQL
jgi:hypothetical protein